MKASDFVKQKDSKKTKGSEVKSKRGSLMDWISDRRKNTKAPVKKGADDGEEE